MWLVKTSGVLTVLFSLLLQQDGTEIQICVDKGVGIRLSPAL